jgi:hypothetical protein
MTMDQLRRLICFYGQNINSVYINNNGNVSFGAAYGTFTANSFPDPTFIMVAPFWADVDTRGNGSGVVYYKLTANYLIVRWQSVGYYSMYDDKLNDFQLILTDGSDPILPAGNNVSLLRRYAMDNRRCIRRNKRFRW